MKHEDVVARMNEWAEKHSIDLPCPVCDHSEWGTGNIVDSLASLSATESCEDLADGRMVQVFCRNCGFLLLFKASVVGL